MMKPSVSSLLLLWASSQQWAAAAQELKFDFSGLHRHPAATIDGQQVANHNGHRDLQQDSPCLFQGPYLVCNYAYQIQGQALNDTGHAFPVATDIAFRAQCDGNSNVGFDYRRATNCGCQASVTKTDLHSNTVVSERICPCVVCAAELGDNPIDVDCTEAAEPVVDDGSVAAVESVEQNTEFIIQTCSSLDCYGHCNGTCSLNCNDETIEPCDFCVAEDGPPGAIPDNGQESKDLPGEGDDSGAAQIVAAIASTVIMGAGLALLWV